MIQHKKIFITGGAGFIGSTLIGKLVEQNRIVAYDNLARNALQTKPWKDHPNLELVVGDVLDYDHLAKAMEGADLVVHCAAIESAIPPDAPEYWQTAFSLASVQAALRHVKHNNGGKVGFAGG